MAQSFGDLSSSMKEGENTWNARLVGSLQDVGYENAAFEKIFNITKRGEPTVRKPDIFLNTDDKIHIGSGKLGAQKEVQAIGSAVQYKEDLEPFTQLGEVFSITYPEGSSESFQLYILPTEYHDALSFTLDSVEEVTDKITSVVEGDYDRAIPEADEIDDTAGRVLVTAANDLASTLEGVSNEELEDIFGGHDFFNSVLEQKIDDEDKRQALTTGASYLFVNQILFYELLSSEEATDSDEVQYPQISEADASHPQQISLQYFDRVRDVNYEPIYGYNVSSHFNGKKAQIACKNLVLTIQSIVPNLSQMDLVGQIFQTLIPLDIRKPLGAHYTNPRAAELLSRLVVNDQDTTVLDPACGSGTLLVSSYRRKMELSDSNQSQDEIHTQFVEQDLTGIDAMMFSSHLAAVNLALEQPLTKTSHVRIATYDSTLLSPGMTVDPSIRAAPTTLTQMEIDDDFESIESTLSEDTDRGPVQTTQDGIDEIDLERVDTVIMNPPFTSYDNMATEYRNDMSRRFSEKRSKYDELLYWKYSQQLPFLLLADHFLKSNGKIAAVLPFTTFTGKAFERIVDYLVQNYTIEQIIVNLETSSFSEDTSLTEVLFIARKEPPNSNDELFQMIGLLDETDQLTRSEIVELDQYLEQGSVPAGVATMQEFPQSQLDQDNEGLTKLFLRLVPEVRDAINAIDTIKQDTKIPFESFEQYTDNQDNDIGTSRYVLGGGWLDYFGIEPLFGYRSENRTQKNRDRLVYEDDSRYSVKFRDRNTEIAYEYDKSNLSPAVRRLTHFDSIDITNKTDFVVDAPSEDLRENYEEILGEGEGEKYYNRVASESVKYETRGNKEVEKEVPPWHSYVERGKCNVAMIGRLNLAAPGSNVVAVSSENDFLLGAYGFMIKGLTEREAKLFNLWLNSTFGLFHLVTNAAITEGAWVRIEQYALDAVPFPEFDNLEEQDWQLVEETYESVAKSELPDFITQLSEPHEVRKKLDDRMLQLIGIESPQKRESLAETLRLGVLSMIETLERTM